MTSRELGLLLAGADPGTFSAAGAADGIPRMNAMRRPAHAAVLRHLGADPVVETSHPQ